MSMSVSLTSLLDAVYRHYPRDMWSDDPAHASTLETKRLRDAQKSARTDRSRLISLMEAIEADMPGVKAMDLSYLAYDACYIVRLNVDPVEEETTRWREVVTCISVIAPVYLLYQALIEVAISGEQRSTIAYAPDPEVTPLWRVVARQVERLFDYAPVEPELGLTIVPDVQVQNVLLGDATLYDCLFTPVRE
jgi:hypothetical protein